MDFTKFLNESKWKQLKPSDVEVYYVYVDKNNMNLNKNLYTVLIK